QVVQGLRILKRFGFSFGSALPFFVEDVLPALWDVLLAALLPDDAAPALLDALHVIGAIGASTISSISAQTVMLGSTINSINPICDSATSILQHIAVILLEHSERRTDVVVFQHGPVIVQHRRVRAGHYVEVVGCPRVLVVVDQRCQQRGEDLQIRQPVHQAGLAEHVVYGLCDVGCVQVVVVRVPEPAVPFLDARQEGFEGGRRYLELVYHTVPVQQIVAQILDRLTVARFSQCKHIERPIVQGL
uniref:Uncharacterized protein n=1 Tax=Anopheles maculatus TaxID=74869 RepID=A0A182SML6_9DIPT